MLRSTTRQFGKLTSISDSTGCNAYISRNVRSCGLAFQYRVPFPQGPKKVLFGSSPHITDETYPNGRNKDSKKASISLTDYAKLAAYGYDGAVAPNKKQNATPNDTNNLLSTLLQEMNGTATTGSTGAATKVIMSRNSQKKLYLDQRANNKLLLLLEAKRKVEQTRLQLAQPKGSDHNDDSSMHLLLEQLKEDNQRLAMAYTHAIHYTARMKHSQAAEKANQLLEEWIDRTGAPQPKFTLPLPSTKRRGTTTTAKKKSTSNNPTTTTLPLTQLLLPQKKSPQKPLKLPLLSTYISPPTRKSFHHVLRAYSIQDCKIPKKYIKMEHCIQRMAELALWYPTSAFDPPNNDTILLVLKCLSNSSFLNIGGQKKIKEQAFSTSHILDRIQYFHSVLIEQHQQQQGRDKGDTIHTPKITSLLYALKSNALLCSLHRLNESKLCQTWINELNETTLNYLEQNRQRQDLFHANNIHISSVPATTSSKDNHTEEEQENDNTFITVENIINCFLTVLKGYVRASRVPQAQRHPSNQSCLEALSLLRKVQRLLELSSISIEKKTSLLLDAYNLVLNSCQYCKQPKLALSLFQELLSSNDIKPNEQSFVYAIQSLLSSPEEEYNSDLQQFILKPLKEMYHSGELAPATTEVYNALLDLYCKWYDPRLDENKSKHSPLDLVQRQLQIMEDMAFSKDILQGVQPDASSLTILLKACSMAGLTGTNSELSHHHFQRKKKALQTAHETFEKLIAMEQENPNILTDESFFYYMKCLMTLSQPTSHGDIIIHVEESNTGKGVEYDKTSSAIEEVGTVDDVPGKIRSLFRQCCRKGLVSNKVLDVLRKATTADEYKKIVGEGRLPNHWFQNVTTSKTLYTNKKSTSSSSSMSGKDGYAERKKSVAGEVQHKDQNKHYAVMKKEIH